MRTDASTKQPPTSFKHEGGRGSHSGALVTSVGGRAPGGLWGDADPEWQTVPGTAAAAVVVVVVVGLVVRHPCSLSLSRPLSLPLSDSCLSDSTSLALLLLQALFAQLHCSPAAHLSQMRPQLNLVICVHVCVCV